MEKTNSFEKWVIIGVVVDPLAIAKIDYKMPGGVKHCTGIAFTIPEIGGAFNPSDFLGEVSLSFNNRKSHPLNLLTEFKTSNYRMDQILTRLEEPIENCSRVSGYYRNFLDAPQRMNIYLQCLTEPY